MNLYVRNRERLLSIYPHLGGLVPESPPPHPEPLPPPPDWPDQQKTGVDLLVVVGFTRCADPAGLLEHFQCRERFPSRYVRMLLIDRRSAPLADWLCAGDWTDLLASEYCLLHLDETIEKAIHYLCGKYPAIPQSRTLWQTFSPEIPTEDIRQAQDRYEAIRADYTTRVATILDREQHAKRPPYPVSIRYFCPGHNAIQDACVDATRRLGYEAIRLQWKSPLYRFVRPGAWMTSYQQEPFDTSLFLNSTPALFAGNDWLNRLPVYRTAWFVDHPARYVQDAHDLAGCDRIGVFDRTYIPWLKQKTSAPVQEVRTGIGVQWQEAIADETFAELDLVFVGELGTRGFLPHELLLQKYEPTIVAAIQERFFDLDVTRPMDAEAVFGPILAEANIPYEGLWVEYIENRATAIRRRFFLEALAEMGLHIFGDEEWGKGKWSGTLHGCWAGRRIDYRSELPRVYANARITLNLFHVQCRHSLNPRVYDVLACGGFLLTQFNPAIEDEFIDGEHLVVFRTRSEMVEKARYYLDHPEERRAIAASGRLRALAKCKYDDRIPSLLPAHFQTAGEDHADLC